MGQPSLDILLVEDNPADATLIQELLAESNTRKQDYQFHCTSRLSEAIGYVRNHASLDLVLLDLHLPDSTGINTFLNLFQEAPHLAIIIMTGLDDSEIGKIAVDQGAEDYLDKGKDLESDMLNHTIRYAIERHKFRMRLENYCQILQDNERTFQSLIANHSDPLVVLGEKQIIRYGNHAFEKLMGKNINQLIGQRFDYQQTTPKDRDNEIEIATNSGKKVLMEVNLSDIRWEQKSATLVALHDVTLRNQRYAELEALGMRLEELAIADTVTGVSNRLGFERSLRREVQISRNEGTNLLALLIELEGMAGIHERYGMHAGHQVLRDFAQTVSAILRPQDHISRVSDDQFLFLFADMRLAAAYELAEKISLSVQDIAPRNHMEGARLSVSYGIIAVPCQSGTALEQVMDRVHTEQQAMKLYGKQADRFISENGNPKIQQILQNLISGESLRSVVFPIHQLEDGKMVGIEFLTRGPQGHFELPQSFFQLCRRNNLATSLDQRCLKHNLGVASMVYLRLPDSQNTLFHFNLLPLTLLEVSVDKILKSIPESLPPDRICLELSEQHFVGDISLLKKPIRKLQDAGISLVLDEVGFGNSSIIPLLILEPRFIKINRHMIEGLAKDASRISTLRKFMKIANAIQVEVIAVGVNSAVDLRVLLDLNVKLGQGYFWSDSLDPDKITSHLVHGLVMKMH